MITRSAVVGLVLFAACVGARADAVYNYVFSNAEYTGNGDTASLSGTFSWDATTDSITASNIDLSGVDNSETVSCSNCSTGIYDGGGEYFAVNLGPQALYITFANSLSNGVDDSLSLSAYGGMNRAEYQGGFLFTGVTGSANIATPEPVSLTLFTTGLLGLGLLVWRRRNCA